MKKMLCMLMTLLAVCWTSALAEGCKYEGQGGPCKPGWWVDTENRLHCRACFYHVEDKEDMNSHVQITDWESCAVSGATGECAVCGWDYVKDSEPDDSEEYEMFMLELFYMTAAEAGSAPVAGSVSGNRLSISFTDAYFDNLDAFGIPVSETLMVDTEYTLSLPKGNQYPYTGEAINPAVEVKASKYGPGAWLQKFGLLTIGDVVCQNNVAPGRAMASVDFAVKNGEKYTVKIDFTIVGGESGDYCKYGSEASPCDIHWEVNRDAKQHSSYCVNHVEDKEDPYSYVTVTGWENCTFTAGGHVCETCGADYTPKVETEEEKHDRIMLQIYTRLLEQDGVPPVQVTADGNCITITVTRMFTLYMMEYGIPVSEALLAGTEYMLDLPGGKIYPYTGEAVKPVVEVKTSAYGPGAWMEQNGLLTVGNVYLENNVEPGTAAAAVDIVVENGQAYTLKVFFTIEGELAERRPGDSSGDGCVDLHDAFVIFRHCAGEDISIQMRNADVNSDQTVDLYDALSILQHEAGWGVALQ